MQIDPIALALRFDGKHQRFVPANSEPGQPEMVAERIHAALEVIPAERMVVAPDCGMKYLSRPVAFAKLKNMVAGRNLVTARM